MRYYDSLDLGRRRERYGHQEVALKELQEAYPEYVSEQDRHLPSALANVYAGDTRENKGFVFILDEWVSYGIRLHNQK